MIAIFCFYSKSTGVQAKLSFSRYFKHCNIITFDGNYWIALEVDRLGIHTRVLNVNEGSALIRGLKHIKELTAMIVVSLSQRKRICWKPLWVRSCNEFGRYVSGIDVGFTFNPLHFYNKLLKYNTIRNYEILCAWRR